MWGLGRKEVNWSFAEVGTYAWAEDRKRPASSAAASGPPPERKRSEWDVDELNEAAKRLWGEDVWKQAKETSRATAREKVSGLFGPDNVVPVPVLKARPKPAFISPTAKPKATLDYPSKLKTEVDEARPPWQRSHDAEEKLPSWQRGGLPHWRESLLR